MIPILYESNETEFASNGLGRLRDCISCKVTEERNSIYECDFEYPVDGAHFEDIRVGRIIAVEHDDTNDVQPFDIVSYEAPIDGVTAFHAVHISYRQSFLTVTASNVQNLSDAFTALSNSQPLNPFAYWTDKPSTGYLPSADGIPHSVRQMLGGMEGSILDTYGGEYEWDRFLVKLHDSRGTDRDFTVRYGFNMISYNEEFNIGEAYMSCIPYWTDGTDVIVGDVQTYGQTVTNRSECVPLDVSEKFESKPTKAEVEAMGLSMLQSADPALPAQTISVEFIRLSDTEEYREYANLQRCRLCDTIKVVFPKYKTTGRFKIVKTVYDVLLERFESMELGTLSTTLAEALGISNQTTSGAKGSIGEDYIRFDNGLQLCWLNTTVNMAISTAYGSLYQGAYTWTFPVEFVSAPTVTVGAVRWGTGASWGTLASAPSTTQAILRGIDTTSRASGSTHIEAMAIGWWK